MKFIFLLSFILCLGCLDTDYGMIKLQGTWESPQYQLLTTDPINHLEVRCRSDLLDFDYYQAEITWGIVSENGLPSLITYNQLPTNTSVTHAAVDLSNYVRCIVIALSCEPDESGSIRSKRNCHGPKPLLYGQIDFN